MSIEEQRGNCYDHDSRPHPQTVYSSIKCNYRDEKRKEKLNWK